ncbi:hypothetical protein [Eisenbergiella sp.]
MKKRIKLLSMLTAMIILCVSQITVVAHEKVEQNDSIVEVSKEQIDIKSISQNGISTLADPSLGVCELGIGIAKNGIGVEFSTRSTQIASEIGCKDIVLQEKTLLGWKDITIRDHYNYDTDDYAGAVVYLKAEVGKTYRVYCTHYAIIDEVEYTLYNITDSIVYN